MVSGGDAKTDTLSRLYSGTFFVVTSDDAHFFQDGLHKGMLSSPQDSLQRGKACLTCRCKCDGARPVCAQCGRRRRPDCEYTDDGPSCTQILEADLMRLQARLKELENHKADREDQRSENSLRSPDNAGPIAREPDVSRLGTIVPCEPGPVSSSSVFIPAFVSESKSDWWELEEPPAEMAGILIRQFLPNAHQLGFALHVPRFLASLADPRSSVSLARDGLLNAIYLWSLRLSKDEDLKLHENVYLQRAVRALQDVLGGGMGNPEPDDALVTKVVYIMQAEVLVAQYLFCQGRALEGRYHSNAAVTLAVSHGFHNISPASIQPITRSHAEFAPLECRPVTSPGGALLGHELPPPRDAVEFGERVGIFWAVYNIDRCWSAVGSTNPCIMSDDPALGTEINTPWPRDMHEYEMADLDPGSVVLSPSQATIQRFVAGEAPAHGGNDTSFAALRVKASTLYGCASTLALAMGSHRTSGSDRFCVEERRLKLAALTMHFAAALPPLDDLEGRVGSTDARRTVFVVHVLTHAAMIVLHLGLAAAGDVDAAQVCLAAADAIARVPEVGGTSELGLLDPVLGTTGMTLAQLYIQELAREASSQKTPTSRERLEILVRNTKRLRDVAKDGIGCPVYGLQVPRILKLLRKQNLDTL
ncbi:hypothetical protein DFH11DRAFT_1511752 [Phellopilus nigrolimitatus]|nr:hypothetical protein DFH11DRAFT_1511752 [Phellopilus nigrolimitatus]